MCGSLAHGDAQGDWGAVMLAARAEVAARGPSGERTIPIDDLFQGPFTTTLAADEIVTEVRVPDPGARASGTYLKLERKVGDYATAAVAVQLSLANGTVAQAGIGLTGVGPTSLRAGAAEDLLRGAEPTEDVIREAAGLAAAAAEPQQRHPRDGRVQAQPRPRLHRARPAHRSRGRTGRLRRIEMTQLANEAGLHTVEVTVNGTVRLGRGRAARPARPLHPGEPRPHRHAHRLRHDQLRSVHRARRRRPDEVVHDVRRPGAR